MTTFDSMPAHDPVRKDDGVGWPDVRVENGDVVLEYDDRTITLVGKGIRKDSVIINVGNDRDVNSVTLTLLVGRIDVGDNREDVRVIQESRIRGTGYTPKIT